MTSAVQHPRALVVGAGFGGIASALRLKAMGYEVRLLDRMPRLGGRAQVFQRDGFTYDAGPTVLTAPFLFEELFELFEDDLHRHVQLVPLDPWYRILFQDGKTFNYGGTIEDTLAEIARFRPSDQQGYLKLLERSRRIFDIGFTELADQPFHRLRDLIAQIPRLVRLQSYRSVYGLVAQCIKDPYLRQVFSLHPLLVGGNPFDTTSIYSLIHYLERQWGVSYCMGGTGALIDALEALMKRQGIQVGLETTVKQLSITDGSIDGVLLDDGTRLEADLVVMNADPPFVYTQMMPEEYRSRLTDWRIRQMTYSMGLFVLFFGVDRRYDDVAHHTLLMGPRYKGLLQDIFHRQRLAEDFSLYLHRPTATDPHMAPPGCDGFYVLAPVPNLKADIDWSHVGDQYRDRILQTLEDHLLPDLKQHLVHHFYMTPVDFKENYLSLWGSGFSIAPLFRQSAWFRFHNRASRFGGLYFAGAGTHPGAGVPGVLSSAKVMQNAVMRDLQSGRVPAP